MKIILKLNNLKYLHSHIKLENSLDSTKSLVISYCMTAYSIFLSIENKLIVYNFRPVKSDWFGLVKLVKFI